MLKANTSTLKTALLSKDRCANPFVATCGNSAWCVHITGATRIQFDGVLAGFPSYSQVDQATFGWWPLEVPVLVRIPDSRKWNAMVIFILLQLCWFPWFWLRQCSRLGDWDTIVYLLSNVMAATTPSWMGSWGAQTCKPSRLYGTVPHPQRRLVLELVASSW